MLKEPLLISLFLVLVVNPGGEQEELTSDFILSGQGSSCHNQAAGLPYLVHINVAVSRNTCMIRFWDNIRVFFL